MVNVLFFFRKKSWRKFEKNQKSEVLLLCFMCLLKIWRNSLKIDATSLWCVGTDNTNKFRKFLQSSNSANEEDYSKLRVTPSRITRIKYRLTRIIFSGPFAQNMHDLFRITRIIAASSYAVFTLEYLDTDDNAIMHYLAKVKIQHEKHRKLLKLLQKNGKKRTYRQHRVTIG